MGEDVIVADLLEIGGEEFVTVVVATVAEVGGTAVVGSGVVVVVEFVIFLRKIGSG